MISDLAGGSQQPRQAATTLHTLSFGPSRATRSVGPHGSPPRPSSRMWRRSLTSCPTSARQRGSREGRRGTHCLAVCGADGRWYRIGDASSDAFRWAFLEADSVAFRAAHQAFADHNRLERRSTTLRRLVRRGRPVLPCGVDTAAAVETFGAEIADARPRSNRRKDVAVLARGAVRIDSRGPST